MNYSDKHIEYNFRTVLFIISFLLLLISISDKPQSYYASSCSASGKPEMIFYFADDHSEFISSGNNYVSILQGLLNFTVETKLTGSVSFKDRLNDHRLKLCLIMAGTEKERLSFIPSLRHRLANRLIKPETGDFPDLG